MALKEFLVRQGIMEHTELLVRQGQMEARAHPGNQGQPGYLVRPDPRDQLELQGHFFRGYKYMRTVPGSVPAVVL